MNAATYQKKAARTLIDKPGFEIKTAEMNLIINLIRLAAVVGQSFELVKKGILHQHGLDPFSLDDKLAKAIAYADRLRDWQLNDESAPDLINQDIMIAWNIVGLIGESGEIAASFCDAVDDGLSMVVPSTQKEAGDVLWYLAGICTKMGIDLGDVMRANITKLEKRYPKGYTSADSMARVDVTEAQELIPVL